MKVKLSNEEDIIENLPGLSIEDGQCIFPFVYDEKEYNECYKGKRGSWCATKVSKKTKKIKRWAYCDYPKPLSNDRAKVTKKKIFKMSELPSKIHLPKIEKVVPSYYVLPNRKGFLNWFDTMYANYRIKGTSKFEKSAKFTFFNHQKIIRDYLDTQSPYRGILLYHGLGVGKTCGSIAIAEGFRSEKNIIVLLNKSLKQNFIENLKKCGFDYFRINQHWFFHTFSSNDDSMKSYAKKLGITIKKGATGAWFIDFSKEPNYEKLNNTDQEEVDNQISLLIDKKYKFYHIDGLNEKKLVKMKEDRVFDNSVLIIDEVHNITNAMAKKSPGIRARYLEELIMDAEDLNCVFLSGTPMINNLFETSKLFNLLRGKIPAYEITFSKASTDINWAQLESLLDNHEAIDQIIIRKKDNNITVTRVPNDFVKNVNKQLELDPSKNTETNDEFMGILKTLLPDYAKVKMDYYSCLPNSQDKFMNLFYDYNKDAVKNTELYKSRILGTVSFYKTQDKSLLPSVRHNEVIELPMSEYMFNKYSQVRKEEIEQQRKKKSSKKKPDSDGNPFEVKSSYRAYSRMHCSFVFPEHIERPTPSSSLEDLYDMDIDLDDQVIENSEKMKAYEKKRNQALKELERSAPEYLIVDEKDKLMKYSPKYNEIIKKINAMKGLSFVYTEYKTLEGIAVLSICLKANGFQEFRLEKNGNGEYTLPTDLDLSRPHFAFWAGSDEQSDLLRKIYNNELFELPKNLREQIKKTQKDNLRGDIIKVLLTTKTGAEGIDLKNVRQVHIVEPYWNPVRLEQVKGRAIRVGSHIELPEKERQVDIYTYISTLDPKMKKNEPIIERDNISSDEALFELSNKKLNVMKTFLRMIKEASVDCSLNYKDTYDAEDPFTCLNYGSASTKEYSYVPNIDEQLEDKDKYRKIKQISWKPIIVNIPGRGKFALKPAPTKEPQLLYNLETIRETGRPGEALGEIITTKDNKKGVKFYKKAEIKVI